MHTNTPAPAPAQPVFLTGRPWHRLHLAKHLARSSGIIAQEIHRLADFGDAVIKRLAGFRRKQRHEPVAALFKQIGGRSSASARDPGRSATSF
jgi:hypothetical protein